MRKLLLFVSFITSIALNKQKTTLTIRSSKMKEDREVNLVLPAYYEKDTNKSYPLWI